MSQEIKLGKQGFVRNSYVNTIDTTFTQLIPPPPPVEDVITVEEFFDLYNTLFYEIPAEGNVNSHISLIQRSSEYIGFTEENDENVQILLDEITSLREELLQTQKELRDTELNALSENNEVTTGVEDEDVQNESSITAGTQFTAQSTVVGSTSGGSSGGSY
jgi:hypothetical protein